MDSTIIQKLIFSVLTFILVLALSQLFKLYARKTQEKHKIQKSRYYSLKRIITYLSAFIFFIILTFIWGINLKNVWISLTGILAMIAVAFFAVWSLIGNILAGLILYFATPFKVNDHIEIMPDEIKGKVLAINIFYTLLIDDDEEHYINVPNSLFFQRYVKRLKAKQKSKASKQSA